MRGTAPQLLAIAVGSSAIWCFQIRSGVALHSNSPTLFQLFTLLIYLLLLLSSHCLHQLYIDF